MPEFEFKTIDTPIENIVLKEKGSKFIGFAFPVGTEVEIKSILGKIRSLHPRATHHCYAYRIGTTGEEHRANDDGEPSGSAGMPIFNQLLAHEVTNILLIVVRYYGGTKLGVSGLVKTYKEAAKLTLQNAEIVSKELETILHINFPFHLQNTAFTLLGKFSTKILGFNSSENCRVTTSIKKSQQRELEKCLQEVHHFTFEIER